MRGLFDDISRDQPFDPAEAARRGARPQLRKRFYQRAVASDVAGEEGFPLLLDGKPVKTPGRCPLATPSPELAAALAEEWNAQEKVIDPARMPLTRLINAIIDAVTAAPATVAEEIAKYLGSDLLCYRAETQESLVERQARLWDPVLAWAREALGARFVLVQGVMHVAQPAKAVAAARGGIPADPWRLGAVSAVTTLTGSALLALAVAHGALAPEAAWAAAHLDEDWQMQKWGRDEMALERRAYRKAEFDAAVTVLRLVR